MPPFPAAAARLLQLLAKDDFEATELMVIVKSDPMLAAELLRTVNSARFARMQPVTEFRHAAALLGRETLRSFAVAVSLRLYLGKALKMEALVRMWKHSLATAACCEILSKAADSKGKTDSPYVAGLLHDIGCLALLMLRPETYADLLPIALEQNVDIRTLDHCHVGQWIAENWKLGPGIAHIALHHHDPLGPALGTTPEIVKVASKLADDLGFSLLECPAKTPVEAVEAVPSYFRSKIKMNPDELYSSIQSRIAEFSTPAGTPNKGR